VPPGLGRAEANAAVVPFGPHRFSLVWAGSKTAFETGTFTLSAEKREE
jgi:hypothetical protein